MNKPPALALAVTTMLSLSANAAAEEPKPKAPVEAPGPLGVETGISFPSNATVRDYEADGANGVWIQDRRRNWYYAKFMAPCPGMHFARAIGVDTRGRAQLDKYAIVIARGDRCELSSFATSASPPTKAERKAARKAAKAAKPN